MSSIYTLSDKSIKQKSWEEHRTLLLICLNLQIQCNQKEDISVKIVFCPGGIFHGGKGMPEMQKSRKASKPRNLTQASEARTKSSWVLMSLTIKALDVQKLTYSLSMLGHDVTLSSVHLSNQVLQPQVR